MWFCALSAAVWLNGVIRFAPKSHPYHSEFWPSLGQFLCLVALFTVFASSRSGMRQKHEDRRRHVKRLHDLLGKAYPLLQDLQRKDKEALAKLPAGHPDFGVVVVRFHDTASLIREIDEHVELP